MSRRLKSVKDLSVLILAPRKHDRQLWADLLKNCDIRNPLSMADIKQAAITIGSGQVDVVFVDEAYGPEGIANVLIPARNVEFAGGRGVCLILCSKKATAQDVLNARKLGFASLVILPASTGTVQKHLELAARYIPMSDEELGWSAPKIQEYREAKAMPAPKEDMAQSHQAAENQIPTGQEANAPAGDEALPLEHTDPTNRGATAPLPNEQGQMASKSQGNAGPANQDDGAKTETAKPSALTDKGSKPSPQAESEAELERLKAPGRSGSAAEEEVVFL